MGTRGLGEVYLKQRAPRARVAGAAGVGFCPMSDVNRSDEDPGANTAMFKKFVEDGSEPTGSDSRRIIVAVIAVVLVAGLVVSAVMAL